MYLINRETDGDGYFHVHKDSCPIKPKSNFEYLKATNIYDAIEEAKRILGKSNVRACSVCN